VLYPQPIFGDFICLLFKAVLINRIWKIPPSLIYCKNDLVHNVICSLEEKNQSTPACFLLLKPKPVTSAGQEGLSRLWSVDDNSTTPRSPEANLGVTLPMWSGLRCQHLLVPELGKILLNRRQSKVWEPRKWKNRRQQAWVAAEEIPCGHKGRILLHESG